MHQRPKAFVNMFRLDLGGMSKRHQEEDSLNIYIRKPPRQERFNEMFCWVVWHINTEEAI